MTTWIICGESWSFEHHHSAKSVELFPPSQSLPSRLRRARPDDEVLTLATLGASAFEQLTSLVACLQTPYDSTRDIRVIWQWSAFTRCLEGWNPNSTTGHYWDSRLYTRDYDTTQAALARAFVDRFNRRASLHNLQFYHWGGHHSAWLDLALLKGRHTVVLEDAARDLAGAPSSSGAHLWPMIRWRDFETNSGAPQLTVRDLFPLTSKARAAQLEQLYYPWIDYKRDHPDLFPDSVHLSWSTYGTLTQRILQAHEH